MLNEYTRESPAIYVSGLLRPAWMVQALAPSIGVRGTPPYLRSDHVPALVSTAARRQTAANQLEMALFDPGKPWEDGANEVQREASRRVPEHGAVPQSRRGESRHRDLAA